MHAVEWPAYLRKIMAGKELKPAEVQSALQAALQGETDEIALAAFLIAWRMKGETATELARAAECLLGMMQPLDYTGLAALDTCGTGGDGAGTFNISTATALVVAAAGLPVIKHGNRAVSSQSGSADVLLALGVPITAGVEWVRHTLAECGCAFCYAPQFHPMLARVAGLRRRLGVRTTFNLLGPLLNPARAPLQLLGVGSERWLDPVAGALAQLGGRRALVVAGADGLDEVTLSGPTHVRLVTSGCVETLVWQPSDFSLPTVAVSALRAADAATSATIIRGIISDESGPATDIVLANAAAALWLAECVQTLKAGVEMARAALRSGAARNVLNCLAKPWPLQ